MTNTPIDRLNAMIRTLNAIRDLHTDATIDIDPHPPLDACFDMLLDDIADDPDFHSPMTPFDLELIRTLILAER